MVSMNTRREFLTAAAAASLPNPKGEWRNRQSGMSYRRLGRTGYMISEIVMGGNPIAPDAWEHVLLALDSGLNYLDTAPAYGRGKSELGYARVIASRKRDQFFLNSKVSVWDGNRNQLYKDIFDSLPERNRRAFARRRGGINSAKSSNPTMSATTSGQVAELEPAVLLTDAAKYSHKIDRDKTTQDRSRIGRPKQEARHGPLGPADVPHGTSTPYNYEPSGDFRSVQNAEETGQVRHLGVSAHSDPAGIWAPPSTPKVYSAAMVAYNIVNHRFVDQALERARK
jgi:aryl-alcohol dehydrogenase-like predicted oxidoreductase